MATRGPAGPRAAGGGAGGGVVAFSGGGAAGEAAAARGERVAAVRRRAAGAAVEAPPAVVSPSVAKADFWRLGEQCAAAVAGGAEWLHFSVQDGVFVPKVSLGSPVVAGLRDRLADTVFDVKLGTADPLHRVKEFADAGADIISFHPEAAPQPMAVLDAIRAAGCASGVVINPGTSVAAVAPLLAEADVAVVMLVNPGHGGPRREALALEKVREIKALGGSTLVEVDGGVSAKSAPDFLEAGADVLVAGGAVFGAEDPSAAIDALRGA